ASSALAGAMGPVGVGIAAVTTVVGIAIPLINSFSEELKENEEAASDAADEIDRYARSVAEANRQAQLRSGLGVSSDDIQAEIDRLENARRGLEQQRRRGIERFESFDRGRYVPEGGTTDETLRRFSGAGGGVGVPGAAEATEATEQIRALDRQIDELRQGLATARSEEARASGIATAQTEAETDATRRREEATRRAAEAERDRARAATEASRERERLEREAEARAEANRGRAKEAENEAFLHQQDLLEQRINAVADAYA